MISWLLLLALIVAEVFAIRWWLNREYYQVLFNAWAFFLYMLLFTVDFALIYLLSHLIEPGGNKGIELILNISIAALCLVLFFSLFLRWIVRQDLPDLPVEEEEKRQKL